METFHKFVKKLQKISKIPFLEKMSKMPSLIQYTVLSRVYIYWILETVAENMKHEYIPQQGLYILDFGDSSREHET